MTVPRRAAIWALGAGQCVYWGVLYYAYAVLMVPMQAAFGASMQMVAGAFSLGLGVNALIAPVVGRWLDRGHGIAAMRAGTLLGAALLWAWSCASGVWMLYAVWFGLGLCMALVLYETAFALIIRAVAEPAARLRAIASVTVMGGLASTLFLPLAGIGAAQLGWRTTLRGLVLAWLLAAWAAERLALPSLGAAQDTPAAQGPTPAQPPPRFAVFVVGVPFVASIIAAIALTMLAIPVLVARGHSLQAAAWTLAVLGVMQLPGRLWLCRGGPMGSPRMLLVAPLLLQAGGLIALFASATLVGALLGIAVFGLGAGLHTVARPWIVPQLFGVAAAGRVNGAIARAQGLARAAGPVVAAAATARVGGGPVFLSLALLLLLSCPLAFRIAGRAASPEALPAA